MPKGKKKNSTIVSEPEANYLSSSIKQSNDEIIISSLEGQEEANYLYWLSLSPVQRLELHYKMITGFYSDALMKKKSRNDKKITITK